MLFSNDVNEIEAANKIDWPSFTMRNAIGDITCDAWMEQIVAKQALYIEQQIDVYLLNIVE